MRRIFLKKKDEEKKRNIERKERKGDSTTKGLPFVREESN
jgi:hypothetical protein